MIILSTIERTCHVDTKLNSQAASFSNAIQYQQVMSMTNNQTRKQQIDQYLRSSSDYYNFDIHDDHLAERVAQEFGQVIIKINSIDYQPIRVKYADLASQLYQSLNAIASEMTDALEQDLSLYLSVIEHEKERRALGEKPAKRDEVGEWIIENNVINDACILSTAGEIVFNHRDIYEKLCHRAKQIIKRYDKRFDVRCGNDSNGRYVVRANNGEVSIRIEVGYPCPRLSQLSFN